MFSLIIFFCISKKLGDKDLICHQAIVQKLRKKTIQKVLFGSKMCQYMYIFILFEIYHIYRERVFKITYRAFINIDSVNIGINTAW